MPCRILYARCTSWTRRHWLTARAMTRLQRCLLYDIGSHILKRQHARYISYCTGSSTWHAVFKWAFAFCSIDAGSIFESTLQEPDPRAMLGGGPPSSVEAVPSRLRPRVLEVAALRLEPFHIGLRILPPLLRLLFHHRNKRLPGSSAWGIRTQLRLSKQAHHTRVA